VQSVASGNDRPVLIDQGPRKDRILIAPVSVSQPQAAPKIVAAALVTIGVGRVELIREV